MINPDLNSIVAEIAQLELEAYSADNDEPKATSEEALEKLRCLADVIPTLVYSPITMKEMFTLQLLANKVEWLSKHYTRLDRVPAIRQIMNVQV